MSFWDRYRRATLTCGAITIALSLPGAGPATTVSLAARDGRSSPALEDYVQTSVVSGIRLSVAVPGRTAAQNSLIRVLVSATNISGRRINMAAACTNGGASDFFAVVLTRQGRIIYRPPPILPVPVMPCMGGGAEQVSAPHLDVHQTIQRDEFVILRGARVAPVLRIAGGRVVGRPASVRLTRTPAARLSFSRDRTTVTIHPGRKAKGPPLIAMSVECGPLGPGGGLQIANAVNWHRAGSRTIHAPCRLLGGRPLVRWHIIAGWPGQPVANGVVRPSVNGSAKHST
jgi:hypothetical protein